MSKRHVTLALPAAVRETFVTLLEAALSAADGDRVDDHLPLNPFGDLNEFREIVDRPLRGEASRRATAGDARVIVDNEDVSAIDDTLEALSEWYAGGGPWIALPAAHRDAVERLLVQLKS